MATPIILLMGCPASGKGTQAGILAKRLGGVAISSGQLLRESKNPEVEALLAAGKLAPSEVVSALVDKAIRAVPEDKLIVLDGFTRMLPEALWLEQTHGKSREIKKAIWLRIDRDEAIKRSLSRNRFDDKTRTFELRFRNSEQELAQVLDYYRAKGMLTEIDGSGSVTEVAKRIEAVV